MEHQPVRRLVLEYTTGRLAGIHQIMKVAPLDSCTHYIQGPFQVTPGSQVVQFANKIKVTERAVYYREFVVPEEPK